MQRKWNPSQTFVYMRTYARWNDELERRETWEESVNRYFDFFEKRFKKVPPKVFAKCREQVMNMGVMPSMRAFWAAGPALEKNNITAYNCCTLAFKDLQSAVELFYILMCGTGVGFSVEKCFISKMPVVQPYTNYCIGVHTVGDSREGWATALKTGLETWFGGNDVQFDFSQVRPRGARLVTMGGRASGPEPLRKMLQSVKDIVLKAQGRQLTSVEWLDIGNMIGEAVVVGGVRRASQINFSDLDDDGMRHAKDFPFPAHRYMSNNTAVYHKKPDMITFMKEWSALAASGSGERGVFNLEAANKSSPRREKSEYYRTNPCVPGYTEILTDSGYERIDELVGKKINVWNGFEWSEVEPQITGYNQEMVTVGFSSGQSLTCTKGHVFHITTKDGIRKIPAKELLVGMPLIQTEMPVIREGKSVKYAYTQGFISGDGMDGYNFLHLYAPKFCCIERLDGKVGGNMDNRRLFKFNFDPHPKNFVPFGWDLESRINWLAGLMDADGTVPKDGGVQISSIDKTFLLNVQKMLTTMGIVTKVSLNKKSGYKSMPDGRGGQREYFCQEIYRLLISSNQLHILKKNGLKCERLDLNKSSGRGLNRPIRVTSVEDSGTEEVVYCFTENKRNLGCFQGVITGQCGEIVLNAQEGEFCNLTSIVMRADDTMATLSEKVKSAVWMGVMQACLTQFPFIRPSFSQICKKERLLGVSLSGQMDCIRMCTDERLQDLKEVALRECKKACKLLDINMSVAITTVKPEGTSSELTNASAGCHPRFDRYYVRRYRISATDPLFKMMRAQGVKFTPENGQGPDSVVQKRERLMGNGLSKRETEMLVPEWSEDQVMTWVVEFPICAPPKAITRHEMDAIGQLEHYLRLKKNWVEHNASISVYVKDSEWLKVGSWVYDHFDDIVGISFFPFDETGSIYQQPPFETITKEEYEERIAKFPSIDYSKLSEFEMEDEGEGSKEFACAGGKCLLS